MMMAYCKSDFFVAFYSFENRRSDFSVGFYRQPFVARKRTALFQHPGWHTDFTNVV